VTGAEGAELVDVLKIYSNLSRNDNLRNGIAI